MAQPVCSITGNTDLYGLGIRLSIYLQWCSMLLTNVYIPTEVQFFRGLNLLFQIAVFSALLMLGRSGQLRAVEPVIIFWLLFGTLSTFSTSALDPFSSFGYCSLLFYSAVIGYGCWFWFSGLDRMLSSDCRTTAFFGHVSLSGWFRTLNKVLFVSAASILLVMLLLPLVALLCLKRLRAALARLPERSTRRSSQTSEQTAQAASNSHVEDGRTCRVETSLLFLSLGLVILSVNAIEYLISANRVKGVNEVSSVGQFLPLLIGAFGLLQVSLISFASAIRGRGRHWLFFGRRI
jgi:hypothetical protein